MNLFTFELRFFCYFHVLFDIYKALSPFYALATNLFAFELRVHRNSTKICWEIVYDMLMCRLHAQY